MAGYALGDITCFLRHFSFWERRVGWVSVCAQQIRKDGHVISTAQSMWLSILQGRPVGPEHPNADILAKSRTM